MKNLILSKSDDALHFIGAKINPDQGCVKRKTDPKKGFKSKCKSSQLEPFADFLELSGDIEWPSC